MLELVDVRCGYGRTEVIHGVSLEVPANGVAAVMGHNGAGKTTLLRAAVGLIGTKSGKVRFDGADITGLRPSARVSARTRLCSAGTAVVRAADHRGEPAGGGGRPQTRQGVDRRGTRAVPGAAASYSAGAPVCCPAGSVSNSRSPARSSPSRGC